MSSKPLCYPFDIGGVRKGDSGRWKRFSKCLAAGKQDIADGL